MTVMSRRKAVVQVGMVQAKADLLWERVEHLRSDTGQPTYMFRVPSSSTSAHYVVDCRKCPSLELIVDQALCSCQAGANGVRGCSHVRAVHRRWEAALHGHGKLYVPDPSVAARSVWQQPEELDEEAVAGMTMAQLGHVLRTQSQWLDGATQARMLTEYGKRMLQQAQEAHEADVLMRQLVQQRSAAAAQRVRLPWVEEV